MKKKVLIIENDKDIRSMISLILETEGYIVEATPPVPAEELYPYDADLILLDEWINKREGHMLCNEIKAIEALAHIPVIILSTAPDIDDIARRCKANGYMHKPFDLNGLINLVHRLVPLNEIVN